MANLTIALDEQVLKRARVKALEQGTSVNALLREYLDHYAGTRPAQEKAVADLLRIAKQSKARRGNRRWTRDELHER